MATCLLPPAAQSKAQTWSGLWVCGTKNGCKEVASHGCQLGLPQKDRSCLKTCFPLSIRFFGYPFCRGHLDQATFVEPSNCIHNIPHQPRLFDPFGWFDMVWDTLGMILLMCVPSKSQNCLSGTQTRVRTLAHVKKKHYITPKDQEEPPAPRLKPTAPTGFVIAFLRGSCHLVFNQDTQ